MSFIKPYVYSSLHASISCACLAVSGLPVNSESSVVLFSVISYTLYISYNLIRLLAWLLPSQDFSGPITSYYRSNRGFVVFSTFAAFIALIYMLVDTGLISDFQPEHVLLPALLGVLYIVPFFPWKRSFISLRQLPGTKIIWIAVVWTYLTVYLPGLFFGSVDTTIPAVFERFFFVLLLTIPFDVRDRKSDPADLMTWPALLGKKVLLVSASLFAAAGLVAFLRFGSAAPFIVRFTVYAVTFICNIAAFYIEDDLFTAFGVESIPVLFLFLTGC